MGKVGAINKALNVVNVLRWCGYVMLIEWIAADGIAGNEPIPALAPSAMRSNLPGYASAWMVLLGLLLSGTQACTNEALMMGRRTRWHQRVTPY